jgi:hypothetical protein
MNQALDIWSELRQAYYGKNGFGGDEAEIYAYTLMPNVPTLNFKGITFDVQNQVAYQNAKRSLYALIIKFIQYHDCKITVLIDGESLTHWMETEVFDHRCHVKVIQNGMENK